MSGYSKLILVNSKSRSIDFSDLSAIDSTLPRHTQNQNVHENIPPSPTSESDDQDTDTVDHQDHDQSPPIPKQQQQQQKQKQDEDEHQAACSSVGAKYLSKNRSVSSATSSQRFKSERERITTTKRGIRSALRRAFSTRRSSTPSVSHEKYCRIHDQCVAILLDDDDVDEDVFEAMEDSNVTSTNSIGSPEKKKKFGILKACKRILGF